MNIAVILARGGSKRIPHKNIKIFHGKPLIAYAIEAAQESMLFDRIIVSTDSDEIANVARHYGADVPFKRPAEFSTDQAGTFDTINHAIRWSQSKNLDVNFICCIYPNPFIFSKDIKECFQKIKSGRWSFAFPAKNQGSILRSFIAHHDQGLEMLYPEHLETRSQDLPRILGDAGQFYWGTVSAWLDKRPIFGNESTVVTLPHWRVQDLDTPEDWNSAELMFNSIKKTKKL